MKSSCESTSGKGAASIDKGALSVFRGLLIYDHTPGIAVAQVGHFPSGLTFICWMR